MNERLASARPATVTCAATALGALALAAPTIGQDLDPDGTNRDGAPAITHTMVERRAIAPSRATTRIVVGGLGGIAGGMPIVVSVDQDPDGDLPRDLATTPDGVRALVANSQTDNVTIVDLASGSSVGTIDVGAFPVDIAISPDGRWAVTADALGGTATIIDLRDESNATSIAAVPAALDGAEPYQVRTTADSARAVVAYFHPTDAGFAIVDLASSTVERFITTNSDSMGSFGFFASVNYGFGGSIYLPFEVTPDSATIVLPERFSDRVRLFDIATGDLVGEIDTAERPTSVAVASDASFAIVGHQGGEPVVSVIDLASASLANELPVSSTPSTTTIAITNDGTEAAVPTGSFLRFIDLDDGAELAAVNIGSINEIHVTDDGAHVFVATFFPRVVSTATRAQVASLPLARAYDTALTSAGSPGGARAVYLDNRFGELITIAGPVAPGMSIEATLLSGEPLEGDAPKEIAVSPDGSLASISNATSGTVTLFDVATRTPVAWIETGLVARASAFTPDGATLLVCNGDSNTLSVIDVATRMKLVDVPVPTLPIRVAVSPDGSTAYVTTVAGTDTLYFISIDGADSAVIDSFPIGQLGAANGYPFTEVSGLRLTPGGGLLAVPVSLDDVLRLVDTTSREVVLDVPTGNFPIRVEIAADGGRAFIANALGDSVDVVELAGEFTSVVDTIGGIDLPLAMSLGPDGAFLYVVQVGSGGAAVVIDLALGSVVTSIPLPATPREGVIVDTADGPRWYVTAGGELAVLSVDGADTELLQMLPTGGDAAALALAANTLVLSAPGPDDVTFVPIPDATDPADLNGDGLVNGADLTILLGAWGTSGPGDLNGDGMVAGADLTILLAAFGS